MLNIASEIVPELKTFQGDMTLKSSEESWLEAELSSQLVLQPTEVSTNLWLLKLRLKQTEAGTTPFQTIFARNIVEPPRSPDLKPTRRKLQSSVLHCRHCAETFTSKISFRIHQRRHTEEARVRGQREGEAVPDPETRNPEVRIHKCAS